MYKQINSVSALFLVFILLFSLSACNQQKDDTPDITDAESLTIISDKKSDYIVICPYASENTVVDAALSVVREAFRKTGAELEMSVDKNTVHSDGALEILVGKTNRAIPEELIPTEPLGYVIAEHENNIIILGGSDSATASAAEYFCNNIISDPTVIKKGFVYSYSHQYTPVSINSIPIESFNITEFEGVDTALVKSALSKTTGLPCDDAESGITVAFELDYSLETNTVRFAEREGKLLISASSKVALTKIDDVISNGFKLYESLDFSDGSYIDLTYPMVSILDYAENYECYFECTTNKSPLEYELGEEMLFTLTLKCDGETVSSPGFYYTVDFDGDQKMIYNNTDGESGSLEIRTSLNTPGFVKIYAAATSEVNVELRGVSPFNGGAGAAINEIVQSVPEPEDFDEFWQNELAKLDEIEPVLTVIEDISEDYPGYIVRDVRIDCADGPVSGYLSIPENAEPGSLGILVGYTGYGVVSPEPTVREDRIVFTVNAHSIDNGRESGYYTEIASTVLYSYGFNKQENLNRDTVYFKNMILRDVQAVRFLKTLKEWDGKSITLNGGSQGAYQSVAVAALEPDITYVFAAYPWFCDLGGTTADRISGWSPDYTDALCYYDAVNFAKRITCETRFDAGLGDYVAQPSGVAAMVNSMSAPVTVNFTQGMTHYYTPPKAMTYTMTK